MKTAISVEDKLLGEADHVAKTIGVSRSRLISMALESYLRARRDEEITEQLNRVYAKGMTKDERRIVAGMKTKLRAIADKW